MFKDYKSNYCPQARMSNYVKLWLKTAQLSDSSLGGSRRSRAHVARLGQGVAAQHRDTGHGTRDTGQTQGMNVGPQESREKGLEKGEGEKL